MADHVAEKGQLIFELGLLLGPVREVIDDPSIFDSNQRATIRARYRVDSDAFRGRVLSFCRRPGADFDTEFSLVRNELNNLLLAVNANLVNAPDALASSIDHLLPQIIEGIQAIPAEIETTIHETNTPFSTHCRLLDIVSAASGDVTVVDRYLDSSIFYRYLRFAHESVPVTVITREPRSTSADFNGFLDASRLFAAERGPSTYRLLYEQSFHDRWLKCGSDLYHLGGSVRHAGFQSPFTLSKIDPTDSNFGVFDSVTAAAREIFGPANPNHP